MDHCQQYPLSFVCSAAKKTFAIFTFALDRITSALRAPIDHVTKHPCIYAIGGAFILSGILFLLVPYAVGFGHLVQLPVSHYPHPPPPWPQAYMTNIRGGSLAARWQSRIGNVEPGSLFAILQHLTMTGVFDNIGTAMIALGVVGIVGAEVYFGRQFTGRKGYGCPIPEMMAQAAAFAAQYAHYYSSSGAEDILVRAAALVAASELPGYAAGAAVVVARAAELAAQHGVDYYAATASKVAEYYGASARGHYAGKAAGVMARVVGFLGDHGFRRF